MIIMIPRLRPPFTLLEIIGSLGSRQTSLKAFEDQFASHFGFKSAIFFPYGRSALLTLLEAMEWKNRNIVIPAYTCAVVPNAIVCSENTPTFVDCSPDHFNVPATNLGGVLTSGTDMVILTPIFGYPIERNECENTIRSNSPNAFVLYDLAHGFAVHDKEFQAINGDAALFGLGIGKMMSSTYGGMLLVKDPLLANIVRAFRDSVFEKASIFCALNRFFYAVGTWLAFREPFLSLTDILERRTSLLHRFSEAYYGKKGTFMPENVRQLPTLFQANLGISQLRRFEQMAADRWAVCKYYEYRLAAENFLFFGYKFEPSYSHFPLMVENRNGVVEYMRGRGIQVGVLIDYSCSELPSYVTQSQGYPNAVKFGGHIINLPNWPGISRRQAKVVVDALVSCRRENPEWFPV